MRLVVKLCFILNVFLEPVLIVELIQILNQSDQSFIDIYNGAILL